MSQGDQPSTPSVDRKFMMVLLRAVVVLLILGGIAAWVYTDRSQPNIRTTLGKGEQALMDNDMKTAEEVAQTAKRRAPNAPETLVYLGQMEMRKGNYDEALKLLQKVPGGTPDTVSARGVEGRITMAHLHDFLKAEQLFKEALSLDPDNDYALENYAGLFLTTVRVPEYQKMQLELLKYGHPSVQRLVMLNMADYMTADPKLMDDTLRKFPQDYTAHGALGELMIRKNKLDDAVKQLREAVKLSPDLMSAQANLGQALLLKQDDAAFAEWNRLLPAAASEDPRIWTVRGDWALLHEQPDAAARCYWESLKIEGAQLKPAYLLGTLLFYNQNFTSEKAPKKELASLGLKLLKLAYQLYDYSTIVREDAKKLSKDSESKEFMVFVNQARSMGLLLEALAWLEIDHFAGHTSKESDEMYKEIKKSLGSAPLIRLHPSKNPVLQTDLSPLPLPDMTVPARETKPTLSPVTITFEDQAEGAGIRFQYFNGGDPKQRGPGRLSEMMGGGIAVLDYDQDGLPDLYLTQGCTWPVPAQQTQHLDRLFRNRGDGQFEDVTAHAGIVEDRFSQGVSAGDYNNDGFPDLYVANIGRNRLYLNNGDGTFSDVSASSGTLAGDFWTTSCAIADLNGDHQPDLYSVNFLLNDALKVDCRKAKPEDKGSLCMTSSYQPAPDQFYMNLGRGNFRDVTKASGIGLTDGRGTGMLVGDLDESGRMAVLLGQEAGKNVCYVNISKAGQPPKLDDRGWVMGLALAKGGFPPAPFGLAGGDVDEDGRFDYLMTNRTGQATTLMVGRPGVRYQDDSLITDLRNPTFRMNGFGVQLIDADLDSHLDFIQSNGDTNLPADTQADYELPTQVFRNVGKGRFEQQSADSLGKYFQGKYLGRSVARMDWNQDGLEDAVVSHLDKPVALLTNTTKEHGNFLKLQLRGVTSPRDPIGTKVQIKVGARTIYGQLMAGDGFQASNEHALNFGLGKASQVDEITIRWPSGLEQKLPKMEANRSVLVVEGKEAPVLLWKKG